jgi:hypothetical protein
MDKTNQTTQTPKRDPQEFIDLADNTYLSLMKDGKYGEIVAGMANLGDYSLRNQMLIQAQRPDATRVNNMNGWNYRKRHIVRGSESIKILAPVFDKTITTDTAGNVVEKTSDFVTGYNVNSVFDITQTDGEPLKEWITDTTLTEHPALVEAALKDTLNSYTFAEGQIETDGMLDTRARTITIKSGLDEKQKLAALIRQIAAALVVGRSRDRFQGLRAENLPNVTAIEISSAASVVARKLGLEGGNVAEPDVSKMSDEELQKFSNNIGVVRSISQLMIKGIENALSAAAAEKRLETARTADKDTAAESGAETVTTTVTAVKKTTKGASKSTTKAVSEMGG